MKITIWIIAISVFVLDRISKLWISQKFALNETTEIIKNIFHLTLVHNTGAAFGIFRNQTLFFISISVFAIVAIIVYIKRSPKHSRSRDIALALILGGAFGNLVDRLFFGYVIDFLDFRVWPVFNVADSAITIGTVLLIFSLVHKNKIPNTK